MELFNRLIILIAACLITSCATIPGSKSGNPWEFPNRGFRISSSAEQTQLLASMQPCTEFARDSFSEALRRYENGLLEGAGLIAMVFDDEKYTSQMRVHVAEGNLIRGRISGSHIIKGKFYAAGDKVSVNKADIIDWYIIYQDRPAEGNLLGKFMLLKQDGLAPGDCDPTDIEFQRYRYFSMQYSFVPPGTDGWEMRGPAEGADMIMQEKGKSPNELNTLSSSRYEIPMIKSNQELVAKTRGFMEYDPEDSRYKVKKHEVDAYTKKKTMCAVSQQVIDDKKALLSKSGKRGPMIREVQTLVCVHPGEKNVAVAINYSHRYQPGNRDTGFINKANEVFESLAFKTRN